MVFQYRESLKNLNVEGEISAFNNANFPVNECLLFHASLILPSHIRDIEGINSQPLGPVDITLEKAESIVTNEIYNFLYWLLSTHSQVNSYIVDRSLVRESNPTLNRYIMSTSQDLIYIASRGKTKTLKHIGLSITCHKMKQSKKIIQLLNWNGQGVSYDEIQGIDTTWVTQQINQNNIVPPSNMVLNTFTHASPDNWNMTTDSVTGEHLDIVNLVMCQSYQKHMELGSFNNSTNTARAPFPKERKRSLATDQLTTQIFNCSNLQGNNIGPLHLKNRLDLDWYFIDSLSHSVARDIDRAWIISPYLSSSNLWDTVRERNWVACTWMVCISCQSL